jgi:hypothetical protein
MSDITTKERLASVKRIKEMTFSNLRRLYETHKISKKDYSATHTLVLDLEKLLQQMNDRGLEWDRLIAFIAQDDKDYIEDIFSQP